MNSIHHRITINHQNSTEKWIVSAHHPEHVKGWSLTRLDWSFLCWIMSAYLPLEIPVTVSTKLHFLSSKNKTNNNRRTNCYFGYCTHLQIWFDLVEFSIPPNHVALSTESSKCHRDWLCAIHRTTFGFPQELPEGVESGSSFFFGGFGTLMQ